MHEDNYILIFAFLFHWIVLVGLTINSKNKVLTFLANIGIQLCYSTCFIYGLIYKSQGGTALVWWFYLVLIISLHFVVNSIQLFRKRIKKLHTTKPLGNAG